jgi:hypothetical protein
LDIDVAVDVNDADIAVDMRSDASNVRKTETVIAPANDWKNA